MIPEAYITEWQKKVRWQDNALVEQDIILTRLIIELFSHELIRDKMLFRGGTALHKIFLIPQNRYSEDIDLVQRNPVPIGNVMNSIREVCAPILGEAKKWKQSKGRVTFVYSVPSEIPPIVDLKFKIEINTREHFSVLGDRIREFQMQSRWYTGKSDISTYCIEELLGTKMRALYQRKKGRDLFDLWYGLTNADVDTEKIVFTFVKYMEQQGQKVSLKQYKNNIEDKLNNPNFINDINNLLRPEIEYSVFAAYALVEKELIEKL